MITYAISAYIWNNSKKRAREFSHTLVFQYLKPMTISCITDMYQLCNLYII